MKRVICVEDRQYNIQQNKYLPTKTRSVIKGKMYNVLETKTFIPKPEDFLVLNGKHYRINTEIGIELWMHANRFIPVVPEELLKSINIL